MSLCRSYTLCVHIQFTRARIHAELSNLAEMESDLLCVPAVKFSAADVYNDNANLKKLKVHSDKSFCFVLLICSS